MQAQEHDKLAPLLHSDSSRKLVNFKLFRGDAEVVTTEELREQVHSALVQVFKFPTTRSSETFVEAEGFRRVDIASICN